MMMSRKSEPQEEREQQVNQAGVGTMNFFAGWQENLTTAPLYKPTTM